MSKTSIDILLSKLENNQEPSDGQVRHAENDYWWIKKDIPKKNSTDALDYLLTNCADKKFRAARDHVGQAKYEYEHLKQLSNKDSPNPSSQQDPKNRTPDARLENSDYGRQGTKPNNPEQERFKYNQSSTPGHVHQPSGAGHLMPEPTSWQLREDKPSGHKADTGHENKNISYALRRNNPEIADLSDDNRPTKIAERYSELYDNEWTDAYDALTSIMKDKDKDRRAIGFLYEVVKTAYEFCCKKAGQQITEMRTQFLNVIGSVDSSSQAPKGRGKEATEKDKDDWILLQYRKGIAEVAVEGIVTEFSDREFKNIYSRYFNSGKMHHKPSKEGPLHLFASRAAQLAWWMAVQDPPVYMDIPGPRTKDAAKFNSTLYRAYTQSGQQVEYYVWPALLLFKERDNKSGPVLVKGVAQGKK